MEIKQAVETADQLNNAFADVLVHAVREPVYVTGKQHTRLASSTLKECKCESRRRARGVRAGMVVEKGTGKRYLTGNPDYPSRHFVYVETCMKCDQVLDYKEV